MAKKEVSKRIYSAHRKSQREKIVRVAQRLFIENGIEPVTVADIAAASRLTRATIYKYFPNRKSIAFEIFKTIISGWHERDNEDVWSYPGDGFQKLERFLTSFCDYLFRFPQEICFIAGFNYMYAREWPSRQVLKTLNQILSHDRKLVVECVRQGIADGSLRSDLDPDLTVASIYNLNSSLLGRLGQMGHKVQEEYDIAPGKIFREIYRVFIIGMKAKERTGSITRPRRHKSQSNSRTVQ